MKLKKVTAVMLAAIIGASTTTGALAVKKEPVPAYKEQVFDDVSTKQWYSDAVNIIYLHDIMSGIDKHEFSPDGFVTRAMAAQILYKVANAMGYDIDDVNETAQQFEDVDVNIWYHKAVQFCFEHDIVSGVSDTEYNPNGKVTREQFAVMLYRAAGETNPVTDKKILNKFSDKSKVSTWATDAVKWAVKNGFISGTVNSKGSTVLDPQGTITRAMISQIVMKYMDSYDLHSDHLVKVKDGIKTYECEICERTIDVIQA